MGSLKQHKPPAELVGMVDRLEAIRLSRALTKEAFEEVAGIPGGQYSRWTGEARERLAGVTVALVLRIGHRLGVHPAELLWGAPVANIRAVTQTEPPPSTIRPSEHG